MMALDTCNASMAMDVDGAHASLESLKLNSYPGENISDLMTDAQRYIKIMQSGYTLPLNTGTDIIRKVLKTQSEEFNWKMYTLLDDTKTMEHKYKLSDPKALEADTDYPTYRPLALLGTIQQEYVILLKNKTWPGISTKLPEGNNAGTDQKKLPKGNNPTDNSYNRGHGHSKGGRGGGCGCCCGGHGRGRGHGCGNGGRAGRNISCFNCGGNHFARNCPRCQT